MLNKIVYIITKSEIGGAQKWIKEQRELLYRDFDIYLITSEPGWLSEQFPEQNVFFVREILSLKSLSASYKIARILRKIKASVVISSSANAGMHGRIAKVFYNHRSIYVSHGWSCIYNGGRFSGILCSIEKVLSLFSDRILCVSNNDYNNATSKIGIAKNKLITITNGIKPMPARTNEPLNGQMNLIFVGRMVHPKRPDLLLEVISQCPDIKVDLVGDGPMLSKLKAEYSSYTNIRFLGEVKNFSDFNRYNAFVLTSDSEGLPMSALEAASAGLPLLLSNVGGCAELIDSEIANGILYENDKYSLLNAFKTLHENYQSYQDAAESLKNNFSLDHKHEEYINLINGG